MTRAFGGSASAAFRSSAMAGATSWAFGAGSAAPSATQAGVMVGMSVVAAQNPGLGQAMMLIYGNWGNSNVGDWAQNAVARGIQYGVSRELEKVAARLGLSLQEFNLLLAMNSKLGLMIAGHTVFDEGGVTKVLGFASRDKLEKLGILWDVNDTLLNAQGLLDAMGLKAARSGNGSHYGHSLGAGRANVLHGLGISHTTELHSLPLYAFPFAGATGACFSLDFICGGGLLSTFRPGIESWKSPGKMHNVFRNHSSVQYRNGPGD